MDEKYYKSLTEEDDNFKQYGYVPAVFQTKVHKRIHHNGEIVQIIGEWTDKPDYFPKFVIKYKDGTIEDGIHQNELKDIFKEVK